MDGQVQVVVWRFFIAKLSEESIPALAAGSSSYQFGRMPDIAAMPVGRKVTASVK